MPELGPYGSVRGARGNSRPYRENKGRAVKMTRMTQKRHHPDEGRAAGRSAIPCYPTPIDRIEEARPFPRRVLRSPSGGPLNLERSLRHL